MAHSRLEKIGTIYSRITGLVRAGAMKLEDRPIWFEVYRAFPPELPPKYDRPAPETRIPKIFYEDDIIRAKFHKKMGNGVPAVDLTDTKHLTLAQKGIVECRRLQKEEDKELDEAFLEAWEKIKIPVGRMEGPKAPDPVESSGQTIEEEKKQHSVHENSIKIDVKDIFKE